MVGPKVGPGDAGDANGVGLHHLHFLQLYTIYINIELCMFVCMLQDRRPPLPPPPCGMVWWYGGCQSLMLYKGCMNRYKAYLVHVEAIRAQ